MAKSSAEAAALIALGKSIELEAAHVAEETLGLVAKCERAEAVAGGM